MQKEKTLLTALSNFGNSSSVRFLCYRNIILFNGYCKNVANPLPKKITEFAWNPHKYWVYFCKILLKLDFGNYILCLSNYILLYFVLLFLIFYAFFIVLALFASILQSLLLRITPQIFLYVLPAPIL